MSKSTVPATVTTAPPPAVLFAQELGLDLNPLDTVDRIALPRIKVLREAEMFQVPTETGDMKKVASLDGVSILAIEGVMAWWSKKFGEGESGPPECYVIGRTAPQGDRVQSRSCDVCRHNKIGKAFVAEAGPACAAKRRVLLRLPDEGLPHILDIPALGLKATNSFLTLWAGRKGRAPLPLAKLKISLRGRQSRMSDMSGVEPVFEVLGFVDTMDEAQEIKAMIDAFGQQAREETVQADAEDVTHGGNGHAAPAGDYDPEDVPF